MTTERDMERLPDDREVFERLRRGLCKEIEATKQELQGKRAQLNVVEERLERLNRRDADRR